MTSLKVQIITPETGLASEDVEEAIIDGISNRDTDTRGFNLAVVRFPRGVRRPWSAHEQDQYAWIFTGKGIIAFGDEEIEVYPGQLIFVPANTMHQHGASEEAGMTQLSILCGTEPRESQLAP